MTYLIDGYNLIFECGLHGRQVTGETVAKARTRLLRTIASALPKDQHSGVTVVFDASRRMIREELAEEFYGSIRVMYSIEFDDADQMIEYLISKHSDPAQLTVVSSDHRLHKAAMRRKAIPVDSGDWYDDLIDGRLLQPNVTKTQPVQPESLLLSEEELEQLKKDVDEWDDR